MSIWWFEIIMREKFKFSCHLDASLISYYSAGASGYILNHILKNLSVDYVQLQPGIVFTNECMTFFTLLNINLQIVNLML
jgi:hypothetical protein